MKLFNTKTLLLLCLVLSGSGYIISCTHENDVLAPPANPGVTIVRGTEILKPGNMTAGNPGEWKFDKTHSSVLWQTNYVGAAGLLTGRFNQFGIHDVTPDKMLTYPGTGQPLKDSSWAFYENEPDKTYFSGYVQINTSNTGEPGRDAGCNLSGMGTTPIVSGVQNLTVTNIATIKITKVEFDPLSADYIVTMNFTWQGKLANPNTVVVVGKLKYIKRATIAAAAPYDVFGLQLTFQFNCRDFGITSTSISDKIEIECNMNFNNK